MSALLKTYITPMPNDQMLFNYLRALDEYKSLMDFTSEDQFISQLTQVGATTKPELKNRHHNQNLVVSHCVHRRGRQRACLLKRL